MINKLKMDRIKKKSRKTKVHVDGSVGNFCREKGQEVNKSSPKSGGPFWVLKTCDLTGHEML